MLKSSFLLYISFREQIKLLSMEQRGILLTAIFDYAAEELPEMDGATSMCFSFIQSQLCRDEEKYLAVSKIRSEAGKKGVDHRKAIKSK